MPDPVSNIRGLFHHEDRSRMLSQIPRDIPPSLIQFVKYGFFGVCSVIVYQSIFGLLGHSVLPHFSDTGTLSPSERRMNFVLASAFGFTAANCFAYFTNVAWVFKSGRHNRLAEFCLFSIVSTIGWVVAMIPGYLAFDGAHAGSWIASSVVTVVSVIANFICRKLFIFSP